MSRALAFVFCALSSAAVGAQECGSLENAYGPFDYRRAGRDQLKLVESHHFNSTVESLKGGQTGTRPGGDLDYTLRAFPNHHRALAAMSRLSFIEKKEKPQGSSYTVGCWFARAAAFSPDDGTVRMLHGMYLFKRGKTQDALALLQQAEALQLEDANLFYTLGLVHFESKDYDKSFTYAKRAYAAGFPLPGLRQKLQQVGQWQE
jgi:tetratricopeptide (TPR) repeat protein